MRSMCESQNNLSAAFIESSSGKPRQGDLCSGHAIFGGTRLMSVLKSFNFWQIQIFQKKLRDLGLLISVEYVKCPID